MAWRIIRKYGSFTVPSSLKGKVQFIIIVHIINTIELQDHGYDKQIPNAPIKIQSLQPPVKISPHLDSLNNISYTN